MNFSEVKGLKFDVASCLVWESIYRGPVFLLFVNVPWEDVIPSKLRSHRRFKALDKGIVDGPG